MAVQLTHIDTPKSPISFPIILVCDGVQSPANVGAIFRICDAFGISKIIFCNAEINFYSPRLQKTARNTHLYVSYSEKANTLPTIEELKSDGYTIVSLEITDSSKSLEKLPKFNNEKIALVIGNEKQGVSEEVLNTSDWCTHIEMYGKNSSMNVVQATSIALYSIINKFYID
jgi:tRNA G18 (ribose-2'-O)-methylase SpoU